MPDSLARLVKARDREHAQRSHVEPERLVLAPRTTFAKRICLVCRRVPHEALYAEWLERWNAATAGERTDLWRGRFRDDLTACPFDGGRLIEVTV